MPELPEVERDRRRLAPVMVGSQFTRVRLNRADLRVPFPLKFALRLVGQTVHALTRRGKYLYAALSSGETLVMHLGMSGSFRIEQTSRRRRHEPDLEPAHRHDHVVFELSSGYTVTFNDPRRFGMMRLASGDPADLGEERLGPEPLARQFNSHVLAARAAGRRTPLKSFLLDQQVVAGIGNIYASEALHLARLSPFRPAGSIVTRTGQPTADARRLTASIKAVLRRAIAHETARGYRASRFRVYDREGAPCVTPKCRGTIARATQAGRSTFYCPVCQRA